MKLILVRHGETDWNKELKVQGGLSDVPLNELGREQASKAAKRLQDETIDVLISSPMKRAIQTAEIINDNHGHDIDSHDLIVERRFGTLEGTPYLELEGRMSEIRVNNLFSKYNVEKIDEFRARIESFFYDVKAKYQDKTVVVVSHSAVTKMVIAVAQGIAFNEAKKQIGNKPNASLSTIEFDEQGNIASLKLAETDHL